MRANIAVCLLALLTLSFAANTASAHCQIPCGIYGDETRFTLLEEHAKTIEKSIKELTVSTQDVVKTTRWAINKEEHAQKVQEIMLNYFLAQRIKVPASNAAESEKQAYTKHLAFVHEIIVTAMKTKQSTDIKNVEALTQLIQGYEKHYFMPQDHAH